MRLIFAGTPEPAVVALEKLAASDHEVVAVITRPDARRGRGRTLRPSPVAEAAERLGIEVLKPTTLRRGTEDGDAVRERIAAIAPDCIPVVAYGNLIGKDLLDAAPHGWVNLHFSLLPRWRGAAPVQAAIGAGDAVTGVSVFQIEEGLDTGDVLLAMEEPIRPEDTADDLLTRLAYAGGDLLVSAMDGLAGGTVRPEPQVGEATYAHKVQPEDARICWSAPADEVDRRIRAYTPGPGAWTLLGEDRFKVGPVTLAEAPAEADAAPEGGAPSDEGRLAPGAIRVSKREVIVGTGTVPVRLGKIQPPGKPRMAAADWGRGLHGEEGQAFH